MKQYAIFACTFLAITLLRGAPASQIDPEEARIEALVRKSPKTHIKELLNYNLSKLDAVFNVKLAHAQDEDERKALKDAQRAWYTFFEADGVVAAWNARGGSYAFPAQMEQKIFQVRLRIYQLATPFPQGWIDVPRVAHPATKATGRSDSNR